MKGLARETTLALALSYQLRTVTTLSLVSYMITKAQHIPCHTIFLLSVYILKFLCEAGGPKGLGDVRLIENKKKLAPPIVGHDEQALNRFQASKFEVHEYGDHYCGSPRKYDWKPSLLEDCGKIAVLLSETRFNGRGQEVARSDPWIMLW